MKTYLDEVKEIVVPGRRLYLFYNKGNLNNKIIHIRSFVDEEYIVFKTWLKHRRRWEYSIEHACYFYAKLEYGFLLKNKGGIKV